MSENDALDSFLEIIGDVMIGFFCLGLLSFTGANGLNDGAWKTSDSSLDSSESLI